MTRFRITVIPAALAPTVAQSVVTSASRVIVTGDSFQVLGNPGTSDYATIGYAP